MARPTLTPIPNPTPNPNPRSEALHLLTMARPTIEELHGGKGLDWAEFLGSAGKLYYVVVSSSESVVSQKYVSTD